MEVTELSSFLKIIESTHDLEIKDSEFDAQQGEGRLRSKTWVSGGFRLSRVEYIEPDQFGLMGKGYLLSIRGEIVQITHNDNLLFGDEVSKFLPKKYQF